MGREIGARKLARLGQAVDLPAIARSGPRSSRLAPWWPPKAAKPTAPTTAGVVWTWSSGLLLARDRRSRGRSEAETGAASPAVSRRAVASRLEPVEKLLATWSAGRLVRGIADLLGSPRRKWLWWPSRNQLALPGLVRVLVPASWGRVGFSGGASPFCTR
jgi:hypothetical protein